MRHALALFVTIISLDAAHAASFYTAKLDDPKAVSLAAAEFGAKGDGVADDTEALQKAIDKVQETTRKGIVLVPEGRYRLSKTVYVWNGIRLIGHGGKRPTFVLGEKSPGFQEGPGKYLLHFAADRPRADQPVRDANPGTFYSGMSNIDVEIGEGNPAAVAARFHVAQHCYLAHIDFRIGQGRAGIEQIGNEVDDCRFFGGEYGITTTKPSPSWPFLLIDSQFEGQRVAGIDTEEGGMTLVRVGFRKMPRAIVVRPDRAEELWMKDCRLEDISETALVISDEDNARSQTNLQNVVCRSVPLLATFRQSGTKIAGPAPIYEVREFCHGLQLADLESTPKIATIQDFMPLQAMPRPVASDVHGLPPGDTWVNVLSLGAKGDGETDDTAALKKAIDAHRALYLPTGRYLVSDTLALRPDTALIGLSPVATQILLNDGTEGFSGDGPPKALLEAPPGGTNIVTGIGLDSGYNQRAVAAKWMAGKYSLMNDVRFVGGHGTYHADGSAVPPYNENRTADSQPRRRWHSQPYSLWITNGGGGTFKDIWTPNPWAQAGVCISDTSTEGRVYAMSIEHHVRNEVKLSNVSNWRLYDIQCEEERAEGPKCQPVQMDNCRNITFANLYLYRIDMPQPFLCGVRLHACRDLSFHGLHVYSPGKTSYDNTLYDADSGVEIRAREIACLRVSGGTALAGRAATGAPARFEKLAGGFENIDSAAVDSAGNVYFVDPNPQRIYRWSPAQHDLTLVRDTPIQPLAITFDKSGNMLVVTRGAPGAPGRGGGFGFRGRDEPTTVYTFRPGGKEEEISVLKAVSERPGPGAVAVHPISRWRDWHDFLDVTVQPGTRFFVSPDGSIFLPDTRDLRRTYGLAAAAPGRPFYVADEFGQKVVAFTVKPDGSLTAPKQLAEEGVAGVAVDGRGNVYVAAGEIFVYDPAGKLLRTIRLPERPTSMVFGGKDGKTLFVTARTSLYAVESM